MVKRKSIIFHIIIFVFVWLILSVIGYGVGSIFINYGDLQHYADNGVSIYGKVVSKSRKDHGRIDYSYNVNGIQYSGSGSSGRGNPIFDEIEIGQKIILYYDPKNPKKSFLGYPQLEISVNNQMIWAITLLFPIFPIIIIVVSYFGYTFAVKSSNRNS